METGELPDSPPEFLPPLKAIRKHKSRIRCAALAWNALEECTQQVTNPKSEGSCSRAVRNACSNYWKNKTILQIEAL